MTIAQAAIGTDTLDSEDIFLECGPSLLRMKCWFQDPSLAWQYLPPNQFWFFFNLISPVP